MLECRGPRELSGALFLELELYGAGVSGIHITLRVHVPK